MDNPSGNEQRTGKCPHYSRVFEKIPTMDEPRQTTVAFRCVECRKKRTMILYRKLFLTPKDEVPGIVGLK